MPLAKDHRADNEIRRVSMLVADMLESVSVERDELLAVGVAVSAPMDVATGTIARPGILRGWEGIQVAETMERALRVPVFIDNASNLAALAETTARSAARPDRRDPHRHRRGHRRGRDRERPALPRRERQRRRARPHGHPRRRTALPLRQPRMPRGDRGRPRHRRRAQARYSGLKLGDVIVRANVGRRRLHPRDRRRRAAHRRGGRQPLQHVRPRAGSSSAVSSPARASCCSDRSVRWSTARSLARVTPPPGDRRRTTRRAGPGARQRRPRGRRGEHCSAKPGTRAVRSAEPRRRRSSSSRTV